LNGALGVSNLLTTVWPPKWSKEQPKVETQPCKLPDTYALEVHPTCPNMNLPPRKQMTNAELLWLFKGLSAKYMNNITDRK